MIRIVAAPRLRAIFSPIAKRLLIDRKGATAIGVGLVLTSLLGFAGLGTEVSLWYVTKRAMQGAADAAAYGAALANGGGSAAYTAEAKATAASYTFIDQTAGVVVAVNQPPQFGNYTGTKTAIEVIIQQPQNQLLSAMFMAAGPVIQARAVAIPGTGPDCVLALNTGASTDILANGSTSVNLIKCGIAANSSSSSALDIVGGATIAADSASIVGGISGNGELTTVNGAVQGAPPVPDPYQDLQVPPFSGCTKSGFSMNGGTQSFSPTNGAPVVFCNGIGLRAGATLTLSNGTFIIDQGTLALNSGSTLNITNATIILTSSTGSNYATVSVHGGATVNATAPAAGSTTGIPGVAFFQDRNAPTGATNDFSGGTTQNIKGALYFPKQIVTFAGGTQTGSGCTQIVADEVDFKGNANLESNCTGTGVKTITSAPKLVE